MTTEPNFLLPSETSAPSKRAALGTGDDPGYVPGIEYDRYGRYKIPHPDESPDEPFYWTRVTTLAGALTSNEGLRIWTERAVARGIGMRPDLRAALAAAPDDKAVQDEVLAAAKITAGTDAPARYGRALHRALEDATTGKGMPAVGAGEEIGLDLQAALACLDGNMVTSEAVEQVVVHDTLGYAGRLDALWRVHLPDGRTALRVGDLKSGKSVSEPQKRMQFAAQLSMYVNATHVYDPATHAFTHLPNDLDREVGYILHVRDGSAQLYEIDLVAGWQLARLAIRLHAQRKTSVNLSPVGDRVKIDPPDLSALRAEVTAQATVPVADTSPPAMSDALTEWSAGPESTPEPESAPTSEPAPAPEPERSPSGRKRRTCSICRQPGHTAKKCPSRSNVEPSDPPAAESSTEPPIESPPGGARVHSCAR